MDISTEIAHLMKYGSTEEIRAYFDKKRKLQKQEDFFSFINDLIDNSPFKRAEVAQRAGLSRDYVYKLLRGDKKTTERDYILALCFALKLDILDTQHALELYPFPILDDEDPRSAVIKTGIMTGIDLDTMNEWLEKASFPMIRTSPDMPSAEVGPARSTLFSESVLNSLSERAKKLKSERRTKMKELRRNVRMQFIGSLRTKQIRVLQITWKTPPLKSRCKASSLIIPACYGMRICAMIMGSGVFTDSTGKQNGSR